MCDMTSHFPSSSAGGYAASGHEQYSPANGYDRHHHHLHQPPPPPAPQSLHPSSGPAHHHHHQAQYPPLQYGHYRFAPPSFDRLAADSGPSSHPEPSPGQHFGWSAPQPPPPPPPQQQQPQVFSQAYDSCSNSRAVLTPPHDPHDAYATCKLQSGLESSVGIAGSPPPSHHNSHQIYSGAGVPSPGSQATPGGNNLSPLYPWMRSQFGQYDSFLISMSSSCNSPSARLPSAVARVALPDRILSRRE